MTLEQTLERPDNTSRRIVNGVLAGLAGGLVFGVLMAVLGMLAMIGNMVGMPSPVAGFMVHMMMSAGIGGAFGLLVAPLAKTQGSIVPLGIVYGLVWWVLGPLTMMPVMMGMGPTANWNMTAVVDALPSAMGHIIFGLVLGIVYRRLAQREG